MTNLTTARQIRDAIGEAKSHKLAEYNRRNDAARMAGGNVGKIGNLRVGFHLDGDVLKVRLVLGDRGIDLEPEALQALAGWSLKHVGPATGDSHAA